MKKSHLIQHKFFNCKLSKIETINRYEEIEQERDDIIFNVSQGCTQNDIPSHLKYLEKKESITDRFSINEQQSSVESLFLHEFWEDYKVEKFDLSRIIKKAAKSMNRTSTHGFNKNDRKSYGSPAYSPKKKERESAKKIGSLNQETTAKESKISLKQSAIKPQVNKNISRFEERKRMQIDEIKLRLK